MKVNLFGYELGFNKREKPVIAELVTEPTPTKLDTAAKEPAKNDTTNTINLPAISVRVTEPDYGTSIGGLMSGSSLLIQPDLMPETYRLLEYLSMANPDFSYACSNIVVMGNTEHTIEFADKVPDSQQREMIARLVERRDTWYQNTEGINSIVNEFLYQSIITGVVSAEIVPTAKLDGVSQIFKVNPANIRFYWDAKTNKFVPVQQGVTVGNIVNNGQYIGIPLNETGYYYAALRRTGEKPYGVPPLISALDAIATQHDMQKNFATIMRKMGMLGFLWLKMERPAAIPGESEQCYNDRARVYLRDQTEFAKKMLSDGMAVGYDDKEFSLESPKSEAAGAKDLYDLSSNMVSTGLKQDPAMLGRDSTVSETMGRVLLAKMGMQTVNHQKLIAALLERAYTIDLLLGGYKPGMVKVIFDKPLTGDEIREQQAMGMKIDNAVKMQKQNIITNDQAAKYIGYEKAAGEAPVIQQPSPQTSAQPLPDQPKSTAANDKVVRHYGTKLGMGVNDIFCNAGGCGCNTHYGKSSYIVQLDKNDKKLQEFIDKYMGKTSKVYNKAIQQSAADITRALYNLPADATMEDCNKAMLKALYKSWPKEFVDPAKVVVEQMTADIYPYYRKDKAAFPKAYPAEKIPEAKFNQLDIRSLKYFEKTDTFYLGKFITDDDTIKRLTGYIANKYIAQDTPIGKSKKNVVEFRAQMESTLQLEDWKIQRIIDTSVNRMRNYGSAGYMNEAGVEGYEIVGVKDSKQCPYCKELQGKTFTLSKVVDTIQKVVESPVTDLPDLSPFLTSQVDNADKLVGKTGKEIENEYQISVPVHPTCRDRLQAVIL